MCMMASSVTNQDPGIILEESIISRTVDNHVGSKLKLDSAVTMRGEDSQCCASEEICTQCPSEVVMEEHPKLDNHTGPESFYEPLQSDFKKNEPEDAVTSDYNKSPIVPDIDRPQESSADIPSKLSCKKLFKNRYLEEENANRINETEVPNTAPSRPAIIHWAPSKGFQHSELHNHVRRTFNDTNTTAHESTAVTHSVPVHSTPLMSGWTSIATTLGQNIHIHHKNHLQYTEPAIETKYHGNEERQYLTADLSYARHESFSIARTSQENDTALDLSVSRKTPSPASSCQSRISPPLSPASSSLPLTPNSSTTFTEQFQALSTEEINFGNRQAGYVDLNRLKEIYTHNFNAMIKSKAHDPEWNDNVQNPNTTKIYPRAMLSNGVKAAPVTVNVQNTESGKMYQCQLCNVMFKHRHHVVRHMRSHTGEKPFHCVECGARFARKCILTNHMRVHTGEKPFICRECGDMFSRKHHLVIHVRTHTGEKPYCCGKCGASFSRSHHLGRHMKTHEPKKGPDGTENTVEQYQCNKCPAKFAHANSLSRHAKMHNNSVSDTKVINSSTVSSLYTAGTAGNLAQIPHHPTLPLYSYPYPSSFASAFPKLTIASPFTSHVKKEASESNHILCKLDSIPVPRTDIVIPPINTASPSFTFDHSRVFKEESTD